jgi:signal transduction histidine kinase
MVKSAKYEVLLVLPTLNAFYREERIGIMELLKQAAEREHRINVRILTPTKDTIEDKLQNMISASQRRDNKREEAEQQQMKSKRKNFDIRCIDVESIIENNGKVLAVAAKKGAVTTVTIVVVDREESLVIEKKDDSKQNFIEAVGMATYSNSKPTVLSYVSIFEKLWKQTELYQQLKQLEFAYKQLKISDKMQSEFISAAAHELRTPIQPIISSVGIIRSRKGNMKVQELDYSLDMITRNAERLRQLSSHILDVTKIEGNSLELEKEQLNLSEVLFNTVEDYKNQITKANVNIKLLFKSYKDTLQVEADRYRIVQVISNLLNNAIKFTRKKGGVVNVEIQKKNNKIKNNQSVAMISVKDTGTGIDPDIMLRLFEKFAAKSFQGVGLGLFISKKIIEAHGGKIWAENNSNNDNTDDVQQGKGATFFFTLPISNNQINNEDKHTEQEKTRIA